MSRFWMVRAGEGGGLAAEFERNKCVAITCGGLQDLSKVNEIEDMRSEVARAIPAARQGQVAIWAANLFKFIRVIQINDKVMTYDAPNRQYLFGVVAGEYQYRPGVVSGMEQLRSVTWSGRADRDSLSAAARNCLGSLLTIFEPGDEVRVEIEQLAAGKKPAAVPPANDNGDDAVTRENLEEEARERIKDLLLALDWEEMQDVVAAVLRAMGYKTRVSRQGSDRGKDIVASPDGLGLQHPRIKVEVKHRRQEQIGADLIRSFLGGLRGEDRGLYVSTGGFSKEAAYEAERANVPLTLLNLDDLAGLVIQHYEAMDNEGRALVPLIRFYWPAS